MYSIFDEQQNYVNVRFIYSFERIWDIMLQMAKSIGWRMNNDVLVLSDPKISAPERNLS